MNLDALIRSIPPLDETALQAARKHQQRLTKPPGSLGKLEDLSIRIAAMTGRPRPVCERKAVLVMAGDHGVVAHGVSAYPQDVTAQMLSNFLRGRAAVNVLARHTRTRIVVVDVGVAKPYAPPATGGTQDAGLRFLDKKVAPGTADMTCGPAMARDEALRALQAGVETLRAEHDRGLDMLALGEMGIGNTTATAAVAAALTGRPVAELLDRGTGIDGDGLRRKRAALERALEVNRPDRDDPLDVLHKLGGLELAGLAGATLAAAEKRIPVVVDGSPATAAAMVAAAIAPAARAFLIASHRSRERGHRVMLDWLGREPLLELNLALGEGTGAVLAMNLAESACRLLHEMATFDEAGVAGPE